MVAIILVCFVCLLTCCQENDTFQSVGLCTKTCTDKYAFGIVQGGSCWCSNVAPNEATNVDSSKCDDSCPGYPDDNCGSESEGLFGYIMMMDQKPSSTATAASTASTGFSVSSSSCACCFRGLHPCFPCSTAVARYGGSYMLSEG